MSKPNRRAVLEVESLEGKVAPSAFLPVLTQRTFNQVLHQIDNAAGTYAKTQNARQFDFALAQISRRVPFGRANLYPVWQADEGIYSGVKDGSGLAMVRQIKADLVSYVQAGVSAGAFRFR